MSLVQVRHPATHDFYGPVHKGLRLAQCLMLARLGACDGGDTAHLTLLIDDLMSLLHLAAHHLENEDLWVHTALETRAPGASARLAQGHQRFRRSSEDIEALIGQLETTAAEARGPLMKQLYLAYSLSMAEDFDHMAEEEQLILPILQSLFSNQELAGIEDRIVSAIPAEQKIAYGRFTIPAATQAERIALLEAIRANAPAEIFLAIMKQSAEPSLSEADYADLCARLGFEPPGVDLARERDLPWGRVPS
jgi:hemerythrin-like domain-containing protein